MSLLTTVERRGPESGVAHALQVTPDNFARAESDMQFLAVVKRGGFSRLVHDRDFPGPGRAAMPWADSDVLRSRGVFDLELGPVSVTVPPAGDRFVSIEALDEDHYTVSVFYGPGTYTFSFDNVSTRYVLLVVRIVADPADRCPNTPVSAVEIDENGCSQAQVDSDLDGYCNRGVESSLCVGSDRCSGTAPGAEVDEQGCARIQVDSNLDGVCNRGVTSEKWCSGALVRPRAPLSGPRLAV